MGNVVQKARDFGQAVKQKVLAPLFGAESGKLSNFTNTVAAKTVGGSENLGDGFSKAILGGKALAGLDYAKDVGLNAIHELGVKGAAIANRVPLIGGAIASEIEAGMKPLESTIADIPTSAAAIQAVPEFQEAKGELEKKAKEAQSKLVSGIKGMVM